MKIRDIKRETEFYTDNERVIAKARKGGDYEIVSEETPQQARENEINGLKKDELITLAESYKINATELKTKADYVDAVIKFERERAEVNADNA
jgi:hypothetical protein